MPVIRKVMSANIHLKILLPNDHCEAYAKLGLEFPLNELRACWKMAGQPLVQRLRDKSHTWDDVRVLIPDMISTGLNRSSVWLS